MDASRTAQAPTISWELLEKSLAHPNALIREKALESAARLDDPRALTALAAAVRDENPRLRGAAAQALTAAAARRHPAVEAALARLIASGPDEELRRFLISNTHAAGSPLLLRAVIECLVDAAPAVRFAAETALREQDNAWLVTTAAREASAAIEAASHSPNAEVSAAARVWSEALRRAQTRRTMLETGVAAILTLTAALRAGSPVLRAGAAWALGESHDARALPALVEALHDPEETVRHAAALALAELKWNATTEEEQAAQLVALGRWAAAVPLGSAAVDTLLLAATRSSPATQILAIAALAETKSVRAMLPLQELLKASQARVRHAAALALQTLEWVPATGAQAIAHAIELADWTEAAAAGAEAVTPLFNALRATHGQPDRAGQIIAALAGIQDAGSAPAFLALCQDGEVASAAVRALSALLERCAGEISSDVLTEVTALNNVVQFQFTLDPRYAKPVRSGMEFVNVEPLQALATAELSDRAAVSPALDPA